MDDCNIFEALGQVSSGEARSIFRIFFVVARTPAWGERQLGNPHKPEAILPHLTPFVYKRFLSSLTLWLSRNGRPLNA